MTLHTYLNFAGTCTEAFRYYEKHLGGTVNSIMTQGEAPDQSRIRPEWKNMVLHARMTVGGAVLMGADVPGSGPMQSAYLSLNAESDEEADRMYAALSDGGKVLMVMRETFFASRFGQVRDRFGINWMIIHERPTFAAA